MKIQVRRKISAWVLLAVFLPTLLFSSLHQHEDTGEAGCVECVKHHPHSGHIGQQTMDFSECLLCNFFSSTYLKWSLAPDTLFPIFFVVLLLFSQSVSMCEPAETAALRAPPALVIITA